MSARAPEASLGPVGHEAPRPSRRPAVDEPARQATVAVGVVVAFSAVLMTFAGLLLAYALVRVQARQWPPPGERPWLSLLWPWALAATAAAAASSGALWRATRRDADAGAAGAGAGTRLAPFAVAIAAGLLFIGVEVSAARHLISLGIRPSSGLSASVLYALFSFHGAHALAATAAVAVLAARMRRRRTAPPRATLNAVGAFVHLVTALWLVVALAVFVA